MTWGNPPKFVNVDKPPAKKITPEQLAASGSEDGHQMAVFAWAAANRAAYPQLEWLHSIPNGGQRNLIEATKLVATGMRGGVWDIFLPWPKAVRNYELHGCYIEMKREAKRTRKNGGLEDDQVAFGKYAEAAGYYCKVCYSWIEARDTLIAYLEGKV